MKINPLAPSHTLSSSTLMTTHVGTWVGDPVFLLKSSHAVSSTAMLKYWLQKNPWCYPTLLPIWPMAHGLEVPYLFVPASDGIRIILFYRAFLLRVKTLPVLCNSTFGIFSRF